MARKTKGKGTQKKKPRRKGTVSADTDQQFRHLLLRRAGQLLVLVIMLSVAYVGLMYLEGYVQRITEQREVELTVELADTPSWASEELVERICLAGGIRSDDFLLEESLAREWAANIGRHPWVKCVRQVRKRYDGRVVIDCELREPVASVEQGGKLYYLDLEGMVLPEMPVYSHLVRLRGSKIRLPEPGKCVNSKAFVAGLQVLSLIREVDGQLPRRQRLWQELARLDVSNFEGRVNKGESHLMLYTKNDTPVRWGAAVGRERPYNEAPVKIKLAKLYQAYKLYGSLDEYSFVELRDLRNERADPLRNG